MKSVGKNVEGEISENKGEKKCRIFDILPAHGRASPVTTT